MYGHPSVRHVADAVTAARLVDALFDTMHGKGSWHSFGFPFLMAAEPLLILMGRQA